MDKRLGQLEGTCPAHTALTVLQTSFPLFYTPGSGKTCLKFSASVHIGPASAAQDCLLMLTACPLPCLSLGSLLLCLLCNSMSTSYHSQDHFLPGSLESNEIPST